MQIEILNCCILIACKFCFSVLIHMLTALISYIRVPLPIPSILSSQCLYFLKCVYILEYVYFRLCRICREKINKKIFERKHIKFLYNNINKHINATQCLPAGHQNCECAVPLLFDTITPNCQQSIE